MTTISQKILLLVSYFLGVSDLPQPNPDWKILSAWEQTGSGTYRMAAASSTMAGICSKHQDQYLAFPSVIHSASRVYFNNQLLASYGDHKFRQTTGFYGTIILPCSKIPSSSGIIMWEVHSYSRYFSRIPEFPSISSSFPFHNVFYETLNIIAAGILIIFSLFNYLLFKNKIPAHHLISLIFSNIFTGFYFIGTVSGYFGIQHSMLITHKIADAGLWAGFIFFFNLLRLEGLISRQVFTGYLAVNIVALLLIVVAGNGDLIQLGTSLPFLPTLYLTVKALISAIKQRADSDSRYLQLTALGIFAFSCFNDIFVVTGVSDLYPVLPLGIMGCYAFILLSINTQINLTYEQRDQFQKLSMDLEHSNAELKKAQAKIVHKSKLEALGTLSAGIAHEINNPLNHVYSFLTPLRKKLELLPGDLDRKKSLKAVNAMKDSLEMVFSIITSLKNFTSLNQGNKGRICLKQSVSDVLSILRSKTKNIITEVSIPDHIRLVTDKISLNQVLINLILNACDAVSHSPVAKISIKASEEEGSVLVSVTDNGAGIEKSIQERIFDPFFTTKKVNEGMGLGLHICSSEIEKLGGQISFTSETNIGTTFTILLPKNEPSRIAS